MGSASSPALILRSSSPSVQHLNELSSSMLEGGSEVEYFNSRVTLTGETCIGLLSCVLY